jgi:hypothetical protein
MTEMAVRDDRLSEEERAAYEQAVKEASALQEEVAAPEAGPATPEQIKAAVKKQKPDVEKPMSTTASTKEPEGKDESVSGPEGGLVETEVVNRVVGTVAENFPWPWTFDPPPPPVLTKVQGPDFIDGPNGNAFIDTVANLTDSGQLQATTHVQATNLFGGVTTGTLIVVADESGNILARSGLQQIGVDGTWVPFKESNRTVGWTEEFGGDVAVKGRALYIAHFHAGKNRIAENVEAIFGAVKSVADFVANFCQQNPGICAAVASAFA